MIPERGSDNSLETVDMLGLWMRELSLMEFSVVLPGFVVYISFVYIFVIFGLFLPHSFFLKGHTDAPLFLNFILCVIGPLFAFSLAILGVAPGQIRGILLIPLQSDDLGLCL
jgi:hypothetical protein